MVPRPTQYEFARPGFLLWVCTAREATSLPYSFVGVLFEFAQPGSSFLACTPRAAGSRPYDGWAIASAWYAETLPGTPGSPGERTSPVRHCPRALPAKSQFTGGTNDRTGPAVLFQMCEIA